jgi:hypothetical protein
MRSRAPIILGLAWLLQSCGGARDAAPEVYPPPDDLPGFYAGDFPCSNCAAIAAALWLRPDGTFFFRQTFRDDDQTAAERTDRTYGLGRWHWDELAAQVVLAGAGPERRLAVVDRDRLRLEVPSPVQHLLERDASSPPFTDRITLDGESTVSKDSVLFSECLTGLRLRVAEAGASKELRRQHRVMNPRGEVALTTIEGHLAAVDDREALVVDRFVAIKPHKGC